MLFVMVTVTAAVAAAATVPGRVTVPVQARPVAAR